MKFLNQAGLTYPWLAHNQNQLSLTLLCTLPAPHQHGNFLVAAYERREVSL
jgi:hypothetical protein